MSSLRWAATGAGPVKNGAGPTPALPGSDRPAYGMALEVSAPPACVMSSQRMQ